MEVDPRIFGLKLILKVFLPISRKLRQGSTKLAQLVTSQHQKPFLTHKSVLFWVNNQHL